MSEPEALVPAFTGLVPLESGISTEANDAERISTSVSLLESAYEVRPPDLIQFSQTCPASPHLQLLQFVRTNICPPCKHSLRLGVEFSVDVCGARSA